jgi:S-adenosylmethionine hydrolase
MARPFDSAQRRPVIALLTDFGLRDHYVGTMKGVILGIAPDATIIDITHDIPPQDIVTAAYELDAAYRFFPQDTVFVVVVDPGVGTSRRAIAVEAGGYRFVGPDNGVFALATADATPTVIVEIAEAAYARPTVSRTFEGRDRFAPAAAWVANGTPIVALGPTRERLVPLDAPVPKQHADAVDGQVVTVDRFGNLITNIGRGLIPDNNRARARVTIGGRTIAGVIGTYGESVPGALCALVGSSGRLEVAVTGGSAEAVLGVGRGTPVRLHRGA